MSIEERSVSNNLQQFKNLTKNPESFLGNNSNVEEDIKSYLKNNYDFMKNEENESIKSDALPELIVQNFDLEQIWQELELQNESFLTRSLINVSKLIVKKDKLLFEEILKQNEEDLAGEDESKEVMSSNDESSSDSDDEADPPPNLDANSDELSLKSDELSENDDNDEESTVKKVKGSIVDDAFFKLDEMEAFLKAEEKKIDANEPDSGNDSESNEDDSEMDEEDIDYFKDESDDMEGKDKERGQKNNPKYNDFFKETDAEKPVKRNKFLEELEDSEEEEEPEPQELKSTMEIRQERLKKKIENIEEMAISDKPWQLKGEITAESRPQNSLLEEVLEFDLTSRPAPVITEETTLYLEDVIRQRIKDKVFDSVERKEKPVETPLEYKKKLVLDQEKSKESLAQIYEKEFLQQKEAVDPSAEEKEEEEPQLHKDITVMMTSLFTKLDALSNFHFTPKPSAPELKIISNLPAINMEEVAPVSTSDGALLAPEEVKGKIRGDLIGKSERTDADKKRERRKKKDKQQKHAMEKQKKMNLINKLNPGLGNKYSKEKAKKLLEQVTKDKNVDKMDESSGSKNVKSSTAFFSQLQDEVATHIKNKSKSKQASKKPTFEAKKMKL